MKLVDICEATDIQHIDIETIKSKILNDCQMYLKNCDDRFLYRGLNDESSFKPMSIIKHRKDRMPLNTTKLAHDLFDSYTLEKFGWKTRSDTLFVTGDYYRSMDYAYDQYNVYLVFPIGNFKFVYSELVDDFYAGVEDIPEVEETIKNHQTYIPTEEYRKDVYTFFDTLEYDNTQFESAIKSGNEIMLNCNNYYIIRVCDLYNSVHGHTINVKRINTKVLKQLEKEFFEILNK